MVDLLIDFNNVVRKKRSLNYNLEQANFFVSDSNTDFTGLAFNFQLSIVKILFKLKLKHFSSSYRFSKYVRISNRYPQISIKQLRQTIFSSKTSLLTQKNLRYIQLIGSFLLLLNRY